MPDRTIVIKVRDELGLPYVDGAEASLPAYLKPLWDGLVSLFPFLKLDRLFTELEPETIRGLLEAVLSQGEVPPNLLGLFRTPCPQELADQVLEQIEALPFVEYAELQTLVSLPAVCFGDDPLVDRSLYLDRRQTGGIDAYYAWCVPGGDGAGVRFVDVENAWMLDHEDLSEAQVAVASTNPMPTSRAEQDHGTKALGIVLASDNGVGTVGIVPAVQGFVMPLRHVLFFSDFDFHADIAVAILGGAVIVGAGGVLLIELQSVVGGLLRPVEVSRHVSDTIRVVTALGVTVIEPAGNGGVDLDAAGQPARLKRGQAEFVDSGAIVVAAAFGVPGTNPLAFNRAGFSTFGKRVDCFAFAQFFNSIPSAVANPLRAGYDSFGGTSGASAVVAGAAAAVQGMSLSMTGSYLAPAEVRRLLSDPALGALSVGSSTAQPNADGIGVMPNLRAIARAMGAPRFAPVSVVARDSGTLDLVGVDDNDFLLRGVWLQTFDPEGLWAIPLALDAPFVLPARPPALLCRDQRLLDAFAISNDGALVNTWWDKDGQARGEWKNILPSARFSPSQPVSAAAVGDDRIDVVGIRQNGRLCVARCTADPHVLVNGTTQELSTTYSFSGSAGPALACPDTGGMELVAIDRDGQLCWAEYPVNPVTDAWSDVFAIGGVQTRLARSVRPAISARILNLNVFAVGVDGLLYTAHRPGFGAHGWSDLAILSTQALASEGNVAAIARSVFNLDVFVIDENGLLRWTSRHLGSGIFSSWTDLEVLDPDVGVHPMGGIAAVSWSPDTMAVFVHDRAGQRRWAYWQESRGWSRLVAF